MQLHEYDRLTIVSHVQIERHILKGPATLFIYSDTFDRRSARKDFLPPRSIVNVPVHRASKMGFKIGAGPPTQFAPNFSCIDCVAAVMPRPILDVFDQASP